MNENFDDQFGNPYNTANSTNEVSGSRAKIEESVVAQSFIFMTIALIITAAAAFYTSNSYNLLYALITNKALFYGLFIGELIIVFAATRAMSRNQLVSSAVLFVAYSAINGVTLSFIFLVFDLNSIVNIFVMTAIIFGITALFGIFTKKDLSTIGSLCTMGLIGIIVVGIGNMFFIKSTGLDLITSIIGVFVFVGLAAYDSQKIKQMSSVSTINNVNTLALYGALMLYLDFINLFLRLLRIFGKRN